MAKKWRLSRVANFIKISCKHGRIGTVSGILNATASIGNVLASYVFAKMSEYMSWQTISVYWVVIVAISLAFCIMILPRWTRFKQS